MDDQSLQLVRDFDRIALAFATADSLDALSGCAEEALGQLVNVELLAIYLLDPATDALRLYRERNALDAQLDAARGGSSAEEVDAVSNLARWVFRTGRMLHIPDVRRSTALPETAPGRVSTLRSVLCLPVRSHARIVGCFALGHPIKDVFRDREVTSLAFVTKLAAVAYENVVLVAALKQKQQALAGQLEELSRAQSELRRTRFAVEHARDSIFLVRPDASFAYVNEAACRHLGYTREALLEMSLFDVDLEATRASWSALWNRLQEGRESTIETRYRRQNGETFPVELDLDHLEYEGEEYGFAFVRDVTQRKQLLAQLTHADRMASIGMLAAGVAHELNNPLTYALYNAEDLERRLTELSAAVRSRAVLPPSAFAELLQRAEHAAEGVRRSCAIVRDLKTFSHIESGERSTVRVEPAIEAALRMASQELRYRAQVVTNLAATPPVLASEGRLSQVFLNLLVNAAQAMREENASTNRLTLSTSAHDGEVKIEIRDTGHGMTREQLDRVFEPFFTTKAAGVGAGLGLWVCQNVVRSFGGRIDVESELDKGTAFIVRLPASTGETRRGSAPSLPAIRPSERRARILIVDDEPRVGQSLQILLAVDHDVAVVSSGDAARSMIEREQTFDLILCDLMMPGVSGIDLHAWLSERHPNLAPRMVFMSGGAFTKRAIEFLENTQNPYLEKPFDPDKLNQLIREGLVVS